VTNTDICFCFYSLFIAECILYLISEVVHLLPMRTSIYLHILFWVWLRVRENWCDDLLPQVSEFNCCWHLY